MPRLTSIPQILCEIASQIQLSDYNQTNGILSAHDYLWKISTDEATQITSLVIERIDEDLRNALDVF